MARTGLLSRVWRVLSRPLFGLGSNWSAPLPGLVDTGPVRPPLWKRLAGGILRRLLMMPILLVVMMAMLVYGTTHQWTRMLWTSGPRNASAAPLSPATQGLYYRDIQLTTADNVQLHGWHIPVWSASKLLRQDDSELRRRHPALVLCHGQWSDRGQLLYLVPALHEAGYELLLLDLRGSGDSNGNTRLGLDEWQDVQAAIHWLQTLGPVDSRRIGLVGTGTSCAAVLRAAAEDNSVAAVVIDRPNVDLASFVRGRFKAMGLPAGTMGRLYGWSLSLAEVSDLSDASAIHWADKIAPRQAVLVSAWKSDPYVPANDPAKVFQALHGKRLMQVNPFKPETPSQPALLPGDVLRFLKQYLAARK
ncbi:MAG: hypothetical protein BIFFINMI_03754 [Phycisphaerae bacterium]|nr:hypothetical protein [Phycisphaerae bacterium]